MPRIIEVESLHVVLSDFLGTELLPSIESILTHERVVESCMDRATPLPFRFGVIVSEAKLKAFIRKNSSSLRSDLESVQGSVEMSLKVRLSAVEPETPSTGTAFLNEKRRQRELQARTAAWVDEAVAVLIRQTAVSLVSGTKASIVRIAHLVFRYHLEEYKLHINALLRERTDVQFLRSGPWPPYSFISAASLS